MKLAPTKFAAVLAAFLLVASPVLAAGPEYYDGYRPTGNERVNGSAVSGYSGSAIKNLRTDADGILRATEEYPPQLQNDRFPAATNVKLTTGLKQLGLGWSVSPFGDRSVTLTRYCGTTGSSKMDVVRLYLYGSDDDQTYYPISPATVWTAANTGDSTKVDTLMAIIPSTGGTSRFWRGKFALPSADYYPGRYLALFGARDSTSGSAPPDSVVLSITFEGRWK